MWATNAGLTDRHTYDSRPDAWPRLRRGIVRIRIIQAILLHFATSLLANLCDTDIFPSPHRMNEAQAVIIDSAQCPKLNLLPYIQLNTLKAWSFLRKFGALNFALTFVVSYT